MALVDYEQHEVETTTAAYSHKSVVVVIPYWVNVDNDALPDQEWYLHGLHHPADPTMNFAYHLRPQCQVLGKVDNVPHPFHYYII